MSKTLPGVVMIGKAAEESFTMSWPAYVIFVCVIGVVVTMSLQFLMHDLIATGTQALSEPRSISQSFPILFASDSATKRS